MKKIQLSLVGIDDNGFSLMGAFEDQALEEGWTDEEIQDVFHNSYVRKL